jgi:hypothetical protein
MCLSGFGQKAITFDIPNSKLFFTEELNGQSIARNFPLGSCYYTYEASLNRISIYFSGSQQTTIFSGSFSTLSISGKIATGEKLAELNARMTAGENVDSGNSSTTTSTSPTFNLISVFAHNGQTTGTYTIPNTATIWTVCNIGEGIATVNDETSGESILLQIGQCLSDEIKYRNDNNTAIKVSAVTINATGTTCSYRWK